MKIEIGKPLKPVKNPTNTYKFVVEGMEGDADDYHTQIVFVSADNPDLERFIKFLDDCIAEYATSGMGGDDGYEEIEGYDDFMEWGEGKSSIRMSWFSNDYGMADSMESYEVTYFNESGVEHKVTIKN